MTLLAAEKITKRFDKQVLLDDVSFTIQDSERIGLVGKNGIGKTSLFEILIGSMETESGTLNRSRACQIDYIRQEKTQALGSTLFDYVASARSDLLALRQQIAELEDHLERRPDDADGVEKLGLLQQRFETDGGFSFEHEIKAILEGLGFPEYRHRDYLRNFSGGERNRAGLAQALAGRGNLLLLDEPTNHLDIESTRWLEEYLQGLSTSYIVVSHDRAFLQAVVNTVWELRYAKLDVYKGSFEQYLIERKERQRLHAHRFRHQQEEIKRLEEFVRRNIVGQKTKQAQSKLKYLDRIKRLPAPRGDGRAASIEMKSSGRSYAHVMAVEKAGFGYGDHLVVEDVSFDIYRGDKVGMIGRNGAGKSTVLKTLIGELAPIGGEVKLGNNVDVAYFDQELSDLNPELTVLDSIWEMDALAPVEHMRSFLARFGFTGEDPFKRISALSGGEKTKLSLARLLYHPANFIIFDEPTNHLDIDSREVLEQALREYDGSCLVVSHDRYFLDRIATRIFHLDNGCLRCYQGNYSFFVEKTTVPAEATIPRPEKSKDAYLEFKEASKRKGRRKKEIAAFRDRITELEAELERLEEGIDHAIPRDDWAGLQAAADRKQAVEDELLETYTRLEELEEDGP